MRREFPINVPLIGRAQPAALPTPPVIQEVYRLLEDQLTLQREIRDYLKALTDIALAESARRTE